MTAREQLCDDTLADDSCPTRNENPHAAHKSRRGASESRTNLREKCGARVSSPALFTRRLLPYRDVVDHRANAADTLRCVADRGAVRRRVDRTGERHNAIVVDGDADVERLA